jgi:predicted transcriptional regulator
MGRATPLLVENIASAMGLSEERTAKALERLVADGQALRSQIDARWGYVYWYAHY